MKRCSICELRLLCHVLVERVKYGQICLSTRKSQSESDGNRHFPVNFAINLINGPIKKFLLSTLHKNLERTSNWRVAYSTLLYCILSKNMFPIKKNL